MQNFLKNNRIMFVVNKLWKPFWFHNKIYVTLHSTVKLWSSAEDKLVERSVLKQTVVNSLVQVQHWNAISS